jgi:uncharacterized protein (DUF3084 family)
MEHEATRPGTDKRCHPGGGPRRNKWRKHLVAKRSRNQSEVTAFDLSIAVGQSRETVDERLKKIDAARKNMREALEAIDELGFQADRNKAELSTLATAIAAAKDQKSTLITEAQALEALKAIETEAVRKALGVPTKAQRWAERGIAFLLGVLGSYIASVLWQMTWPQ